MQFIVAAEDRILIRTKGDFQKSRQICLFLGTRLPHTSEATVVYNRVLDSLLNAIRNFLFSLCSQSVHNICLKTLKRKVVSYVLGVCL